MSTKILVKFIFLLALSVLFSVTVIAETVTYTGTATTSVSKTLMPLGNGDSVVSAASYGVAAISTDPPTLLAIRCNGLGVVGAEDSYTVDFYCTLSENETDTLDLKGQDTLKGGKATVIGGSGKWKGATGKGTFDRVEATELGNKSMFKLKITTP